MFFKEAASQPMTGVFRVLALAAFFCLILIFGTDQARGETETMARKLEAKPFRYRFAMGDRYSYRVSVGGEVQVETPGGIQRNPIQIEMEVAQTVLSIEGGKARIEVVISSAKTLQDGEEATLPEQGARSVMLMDERGQIEYVSGTGAWQGSEFAQMLFPEAPLSPGDSWTQTARSSQGVPAETRTRYSFTGLTKWEGLECAQFESRLQLEPALGREEKPFAISRGRTLFGLEAGQVVMAGADSKFTFRVPIPGQPEAFATSVTTLHTEMVLLPPAPSGKEKLAQ